MKALLKFFLFVTFVATQSCSSGSKNEKADIEQDTIKKSVSVVKAEGQSIITCPKCGFKKAEILPTEVCQLKYSCSACNAELLAKEGDCCVFCSYGDEKCPSKKE